MVDGVTTEQLGPTRAAAERVKINYDLEGALQAGVTAPEIAQSLSERANYDYEGARNAGVSDDEIINLLSTARMPSRTAAVGEGVTRGAIVGVPAAGAAAAGAVAGAPLGPVGSLVFGTLGLLSGALSGSLAESGLEQLGVLPSGPVVPGRRPLLEAGRTFGSGLPTIGGIGLIARTLPRYAYRPGGARTPAEQIVMRAQEAPGTFAAIELGTLGASSFGAAVAEKEDPGNALLRAGLEITFGAINPVAITEKSISGARSVLSRVLPAFTERGRQNRLGTRLVEILGREGEDPQAVIRRLREDDEIDRLAKEAGIDLGSRTTAVKSGSAALQAIARAVQESDPQLGPTLRRAAAQNLEGIGKLLDVMVAMDDPSILSAAHRIRDDGVRDGLQQRLDLAIGRATETAGKILGQDAAAGIKAGTVIANETRAALQEARMVERNLYAAVDKKVPAEADSFFSQYDELLSEAILDPKTNEPLPSQRLPALVEEFAKSRRPYEETDDAGNVTIVTPEISLGDLMNFRSAMLEGARSAAANKNFGDARVYGLMAEAALEDIGLVARNMPELETAYSFSRALNDVFSRSFAGDVLAKRPSGAPQISPDVLHAQLFASGGDALTSRLVDINEAVGFMAQQGGTAFAETSAARLGTVMAAEDTILRMAVEDKVLNTETGRVNPDALRRFMDRNATTLDMFPRLKADLSDALTAERTLRDVIDANSLEIRSLENQKAFQAALKSKETPGGAIAIALGTPGKSPDPDAVKNLKDLIKTVNTSGYLAPAARAGLRDAVLDRGIFYATNNDGSLDFGKFRQFMMQPISRGQPSVASILRDGGILSDVEVTRLSTLLREVDNVQTALNKEGPVSKDTLIDAPSAVYDFVVRMGSLKLGKSGSRATSGESLTLTEASAVVSLAKNFFERAPLTGTQAILTKAIEDPKFMALLLEKPAGRSARLRHSRQLNAYLVNAGIISAPDEEEVGAMMPDLLGAAEAAVPETGRQIVSPAEMVARMPPPAQPVPPRPAAVAPAAPSAPAPPRAAPVGPPPPVTNPPAGRAAAPSGRAGYAAMFPSDVVSPVIRAQEAQGIAGLLGPQ